MPNNKFITKFALMSMNGCNFYKTIIFSVICHGPGAVILLQSFNQVVTSTCFSILPSASKHTVTYRAFISDNTFVKISFRVLASPVTVYRVYRIFISTY